MELTPLYQKKMQFDASNHRRGGGGEGFLDSILKKIQLRKKIPTCPIIARFKRRDNDGIQGGHIQKNCVALSSSLYIKKLCEKEWKETLKWENNPSRSFKGDKPSVDCNCDKMFERVSFFMTAV